MPSVLVETGYLSNPAEEKYLNSDYGQSIIASAIFRAFRSFIQQTNLKEDRQTVYKVQILAANKHVDVDSQIFEELDEKVEEIINPNSENYKYKYMVGREYDFKRAELLAKKLSACCFKDAFVVRLVE